MLDKIKSKIIEMYKSGFCIRRVIRRYAPEESGYYKLWGWFGLSYVLWITIPRVLAHEMSCEWQSKMAELLNEYDKAWNFDEIDCNIEVRLRQNNKLIKTPGWLINYRRPDYNKINKLRAHNVL